MKRVVHEWSRHYSGLNLFREDLEALIDIATREMDQSRSEEDVSIRMGEFVVEKADELDEMPSGSVDELDITIGGDRMHLLLETDHARLDVKYPEDTKLLGVAGRIDEVLMRTKNIRSYALSVAWFLFPHGVLSLGGLAVFLWAGTFHGVIMISFVAFAGLAMMLLSIGLNFLRRLKLVQISLSYSHEKQSFFKRNKDAILVNLISGITGVGLGIGGTLLVQWLTGKQ